MGISVLIVDNSSVMRKIVERSLRQAYTAGIDSVVEAGDGAEALQVLNGDPVNVIFSDINMPNVNGLELLQKLKETPHKAVPVIMVTTEGGEKTSWRLSHSGRRPLSESLSPRRKWRRP